MNKLTLPRWWEVLLLLLPIVGTIVALFINIFLPIGVVVVMNRGNSLRIVRSWPLLQGMLLLAPILSMISLIVSSILFSLPPIGGLVWIILLTMLASYTICGIVYNKALVEVSSMSLYVKARRKSRFSL